MSTHRLTKINDKYNRDTNVYNSILPLEEVHLNTDFRFLEIVLIECTGYWYKEGWILCSDCFMGGENFNRHQQQHIKY